MDDSYCSFCARVFSKCHPNINSSEETSINDGDEDKLKAAEPKHFPGPRADAEPEIRHDGD